MYVTVSLYLFTLFSCAVAKIRYIIQIDWFVVEDVFRKTIYSPHVCVVAGCRDNSPWYLLDDLYIYIFKNTCLRFKIDFTIKF